MTDMLTTKKEHSKKVDGKLISGAASQTTVMVLKHVDLGDDASTRV